MLRRERTGAAVEDANVWCAVCHDGSTSIAMYSANQPPPFCLSFRPWPSHCCDPSLLCLCSVRLISPMSTAEIDPANVLPPSSKRAPVPSARVRVDDGDEKESEPAAAAAVRRSPSVKALQQQQQQQQQQQPSVSLSLVPMSASDEHAAMTQRELDDLHHRTGAMSAQLQRLDAAVEANSARMSAMADGLDGIQSLLRQMQQQQQAQAQQLRGRSLGPSQGASQGPSAQGAQNNMSQSGLSRVGSALSYNTAAPMYSLYAADSMNFARSGSESLASNLTQDLMGSLSSSSSLLFTTSPHTPLSALSGANPANPVRVSSLSNTNNNNNSTNNAIIDSVDTSDFLQEHYNQFS